MSAKSMCTRSDQANVSRQTYVALGSNKGERTEYLNEAITHVQDLGVKELVASSFMETAPVDMQDDSGPFLNAAIAFKCEWSPGELLKSLQRIEIEMGRPREHQYHVARVVDLDLIAVGDLVLSEVDLVLPHPRAHERDFVLAPLAEIAPDLILPGQTLTVSRLLSAL